MMWRRMLLQAGVCVAGAALAVFGWLAYRHTNSEAVRRQVEEHIRSQWQNVDVEVGAAWLRPLGGISVRDLRVRRRDDPQHPFLTVPAATIYHDKQQLTQSGRLVIRKIELQQPKIHLRRGLDGKWNVAGLSKPGRFEGHVPTLVIHDGVIRYEDRTGGIERPVVEIRDLDWTVINDPAAVLAFQGNGTSQFGPINVRGNWTLKECELAATVEFPAIAFNPRLTKMIEAHVPALRGHLAGIEGKADATLELRYEPKQLPALKPDLTVRLRDCRVNHPRLPLTLERVWLTARYRDNQITVEQCKACTGESEFALSLQGRVPADGASVDDAESLLDRFDLTVNNLTLSPQLLQRLPPALASLDRRFQPSGPLSLTYNIDRRGHAWSKRFIVKAEGLKAEYHGFPYPAHDVRGTLDQLIDSTGEDRLKVDLTARLGDCIATIQGESGGEGQKEWMDITIRCNGLPIDEKLLKALRKNRAAVEKFHPTGHIDFVAIVKQKPGEPTSTERFLVHLRDVAVRYDAFPYPLEQVNGSLDILCASQMRIDLRQIRGQHHGGELRIAGYNVSGASGSVIRLTVEGRGVPLDHDVAKGMAAIKLDSTWTSLGPRGRANFTAQLTHIERASPPNAPPVPGDLEVQFDELHFDSLTPDFLPYELRDVRCTLKYGRDQITIGHLQGRHGASHLRIGPTLMIVKPEGGMWARIRKLQLMPLVPDDDLMRALPSGLRDAFEAMRPSGPISFDAELLVVDLAPRKAETVRNRRGITTVRATSSPVRDRDNLTTWLYWENAGLTFTGATVKLGVTWEQVYGEFATKGEYRNGQLGAVDGNLLVKSANILKQPVQQVHAKLLIDPGHEPGVLKIKNFRAQVYGGEVGGEGRVRLDPLEYRLSLKGVQLQVAEIAKQNRLGNGADLSGIATAQLVLAGAGSEWKNLRGGGTFDIPKGRIYNLPLLLDLLKFVKLRAPDGTAFEEAHAAFTIHGHRLHFDQIELLGNLISLTGDGDVQLDTMQTHLDIYTVWSRLVQLLPGPGKEITSAISRNLFRIELNGKLDGKVQFQQQAVPVLVDPVKRLLERMRAY